MVMAVHAARTAGIGRVCGGRRAAAGHRRLLQYADTAGGACRTHPLAVRPAGALAKNLLCHKAAGVGASSISRCHQSQPADISHRRAPHIEPPRPRQKHRNPIGINQRRQKAASGRRYRPIGGRKSGPGRARPMPGAPAGRTRPGGMSPVAGDLFVAGSNNFFCVISQTVRKSSPETRGRQPSVAVLAGLAGQPSVP